MKNPNPDPISENKNKNTSALIHVVDKMKHLLISLAIIIVGTSGIVHGQESSERKSHLNLDRSGLAIQGYDPVSYFSDKGPEKGNKEFTLYHQGVTYYFQNAENRSKFEASPAKHQPVYGGWCAYAIAHSGQKVEVDPETYKIIDHRIYLFYNFYFTNTLKKWNQDETKLKQNADSNWEKIIE